MRAWRSRETDPPSSILLFFLLFPALSGCHQSPLPAEVQNPRPLTALPSARNLLLQVRNTGMERGLRGGGNDIPTTSSKKRGASCSNTESDSTSTGAKTCEPSLEPAPRKRCFLPRMKFRMDRMHKTFDVISSFP